MYSLLGAQNPPTASDAAEVVEGDVLIAMNEKMPVAVGILKEAVDMNIKIHCFMF